MTLPKPRLKLIHNGLILVSVPLILGLVLVLTLNSALQHTLQLRKQIERRAIASAAVSKLATDLVEARSDLAASQFLKDERAESRFTSEMKQAAVDLNEMKSVVQNRPQHYQSLQEVIPVGEKTIALLTNFKQQLSGAEGQSPAMPSDVWNTLDPDVERSIQFLRTRARVLCDLVPLDAMPAKQYDQSVQQALAIVLAINIVLCPLLVLYFSQNVVRRLGVLISNSERFAQGKELINPVDGDDEIAHLDKMFRTMAQTITRARQTEQDMIAMVSHDVRTPLSALQGTLTLIADGVYGPLSSSGLEKVKAAEENIDRLVNMVNDLLEIEKAESRKSAVELKPVFVREAVAKSIQTISGFALYKKINISFPETDSVVLASEERLIQVIVNILSNAIKFSPDGATVGITVVEPNASEIEIRITDSGRGVPQEIREAIFDRFRQADGRDSDNQRGMGLGLAICKAIIEDHGGNIGVDSAEGKGSTFWFRLKRAVKPATLSPTS